MDNSPRKKRSEGHAEDEEFEYTDEARVVPDEESLRRAQRKSARQKEGLDVCLKEKQEYLDGWQRARADLLNLRRQFQAQQSEQAQFATQGLIAELLGVLDSFDMAFANKDAWERVDANWRTGVEYIHQQLLSVLESHGVAPFSPDGAPFDPTEHESVAVESTDVPEDAGKIAHVLQRGYRLKGKLLRPAKVRVLQYGGEDDISN